MGGRPLELETTKLVKRGERIGIEAGRREATREAGIAHIETLRELDVPDAQILTNLVGRFHMDENEAIALLTENSR